MIIHTVPFELVGHFGLADYVPAVSSNEPPFEGPCLGTQVFAHRDSKLAVLLPRSPVIKARTEAHVQSLLAFIKDAKFARALLVTGADAAARSDDALRVESPFRQMTFDESPAWAQLRTSVEPYSSSLALGTQGVPLIPAGGLSRRTLEALVGDAETRSGTAALIAYTADGDNRAMAHALASQLAQAIGTQDKGAGWKEPASWSVGLSGEPLSWSSRSEMFG